METGISSVTVSTKFRYVIPQKVREILGIEAGQKMTVLAYDNRIVLIPIRPIQESRESLKGMDAHVERDDEDRA
jgi:AbrB family looped-hinge helix DNA binding protein